MGNVQRLSEYWDREILSISMISLRYSLVPLATVQSEYDIAKLLIYSYIETDRDNDIRRKCLIESGVNGDGTRCIVFTRCIKIFEREIL